MKQQEASRLLSNNSRSDLDEAIQVRPHESLSRQFPNDTFISKVILILRKFLFSFIFPVVAFGLTIAIFIMFTACGINLDRCRQQ